MENKKKTIFNVIFLLVVFAGTMYGVFHGEDIGEIVKILEQVNVLWLIPGVICVVVFIWGESIIIYYMMRTLKIRLKKWTCFLFSSVGFFFSCITPSASGGQPAQIYYMKKEKIPIPVSTLVLMIVTITYKLVLVVVGLWLVLFGQGFIHKYLWSIRHIFYLGTALNVFCVTAMLVLVFHPRLAREILVKGMALLEKLHYLHHKEARIEKLNASMDQYRDTAVFLKEHKQVIVNVFAITMFQRFALFTATWFVYKAFGLGGAKAVAVITLQAVIAVSVDMLPLPGGMGISEKLFAMIFIPVFGKRLLLPGMILSRGIGYYTELGLSALLTIVANFTIGRIARTKKNRTEVEKRFGIQIDSLSDIVCFGVAPAVLCYCFGMRGVIGVAILMFYVLAGLIRLAWFNVMEEQRQEETAEKRECYQGLPITSMAIALPLVVVLKPFLGCEFMLAMHVVMLVVGILFITNFKFRKPKNLTMGAIVVIVAMAVIGILVRHYMRYMSMI